MAGGGLLSGLPCGSSVLRIWNCALLSSRPISRELDQNQSCQDMNFYPHGMLAPQGRSLVPTVPCWGPLPLPFHIFAWFKIFLSSGVPCVFFSILLPPPAPCFQVSCSSWRYVCTPWLKRTYLDGIEGSSSPQGMGSYPMGLLHRSSVIGSGMLCDQMSILYPDHPCVGLAVTQGVCVKVLHSPVSLLCTLLEHCSQLLPHCRVTWGAVKNIPVPGLHPKSIK